DPTPSLPACQTVLPLKAMLLLETVRPDDVSHGEEPNPMYRCCGGASPLPKKPMPASVVDPSLLCRCRPLAHPPVVSGRLICTCCPANLSGPVIVSPALLTLEAAKSYACLTALAVAAWVVDVLVTV